MSYKKIAEMAQELHEAALSETRKNHHLSNKEIELLAVLSEELGEAQHAIGKVLRWGWKEHNGTNNRQKLELELGDVLAAIQLLERIEFDTDAVSNNCESKLSTVDHFLQYQD